MEKFLQIAPHSLAIVLGPVGEASGSPQPRTPPARPQQLARHHIGYEIFADFKAENMQHFWNKKVTAAVAETFFLGWIDEQVLLIQGKEEHLEALREGWTRRALRPPSGFQIRCLVPGYKNSLVTFCEEVKSSDTSKTGNPPFSPEARGARIHFYLTRCLAPRGARIHFYLPRCTGQIQSRFKGVGPIYAPQKNAQSCYWMEWS